MQFFKAVSFTLKNEGDYTVDKGGKTKYGISQHAFPDIDIENLTVDQATALYYQHYWNPLYEQMPSKIATKLFDIGVNVGVERSVRILQFALNTYMRCNLKVDGVFGEKTLNCVNKCYVPSVYSTFIFEVSKHYESLKDQKNFIGWINRLYRQP